jgi:ribosome biogenesis GTPase / thiamine phosphate phosphatase
MGKKGKRKAAAAARLTGPQMQGRVIRSVGSSHRVETADGAQLDCVVRGKFRLKGGNSTNPVAVGDWVKLIAPEEEGELGVITDISPRQNYLLRKAIAQTRRVHILAANLDQAVLILTVAHPATSTGFANRFLVVAEAYQVPAHILINKIDLIQTDAEKARLAELRQVYQSIGYSVTEVSALDDRYREVLRSLLQDKVSFIGGHSGAGKSTLINLIDPALQLKTGDISSASQKGRHTTTYAEMFPLQGGGYIIDSPGIKELGLAEFEREELSHYFPEMRARMGDCRFSNCIHVNEPGCAVKAALEAGAIHASRYDSYLRMLEEVEG